MERELKTNKSNDMKEKCVKIVQRFIPTIFVHSDSFELWVK